MAGLKLNIAFDDKAEEQEFYHVKAMQNEQAFVQWIERGAIGSTVDALQGATAQDEKDFVLFVLADNLVNEHKSLKVQQATASLQKQLQAAAEQAAADGDGLQNGHPLPRPKVAKLAESKGKK